MDDQKRRAGEIYLRYRDEIWRYLASLGGGEIADDLLQQVFLNFLGKGEHLRGDPRPFLYRSAYNLWVDFRRRDMVEERAHEKASPPESVECRMDRSEEIRLAIQGFLAGNSDAGERLNSRQREILHYRILGALQVTHIAKAMGISRRTAHRELRIAIDGLREYLEGLGLDPEGLE